MVMDSIADKHLHPVDLLWVIMWQNADHLLFEIINAIFSAELKLLNLKHLLRMISIAVKE